MAYLTDRLTSKYVTMQPISFIIQVTETALGLQTFTTNFPILNWKNLKPNTYKQDHPGSLPGCLYQWLIAHLGTKPVKTNSKLSLLNWETSHSGWRLQLQTSQVGIQTDKLQRRARH